MHAPDSLRPADGDGPVPDQRRFTSIHGVSHHPNRRNIKERLDKELERNLALRVEPGDTADSFIVSGRGALHISILIENMRCGGRHLCLTTGLPAHMGPDTLRLLPTGTILHIMMVG